MPRSRLPNILKNICTKRLRNQGRPLRPEQDSNGLFSLKLDDDDCTVLLSTAKSTVMLLLSFFYSIQDFTALNVKCSCIWDFTVPTVDAV
jgi:hypothetical protein